MCDDMSNETDTRGRTKKAAVTSALQEHVRRRRQLQILNLVGRIPMDATYDYKRLRHRKPPR
jgi:hypothetical protein